MHELIAESTSFCCLPAPQLLTFLQHLCNYFSGSPKRLSGLKASAAMLHVQLWALQSPGDTRWLANREALDSVLKDLAPLMDRLEYVSMHQHEVEATNLFAELTEVETLLSMFMAVPVMDCLGSLCKILQVCG